MQDFATLIVEHDRMDAMAADLIAMVDAQDGHDPAEAYDKVRALALCLDTHLAHEDEYLYAGDAARTPALLDRAVGRLTTDFAALKAEWSTYLREWSEENISIDWPSFARATVWMMEQLRARIAFENAVLYPLALQYGRIRLRPS